MKTNRGRYVESSKAFASSEQFVAVLAELHADVAPSQPQPPEAVPPATPAPSPARRPDRDPLQHRGAVCDARRNASKPATGATATGRYAALIARHHAGTSDHGDGAAVEAGAAASPAPTARPCGCSSRACSPASYAAAAYRGAVNACSRKRGSCSEHRGANTDIRSSARQHLCSARHGTQHPEPRSHRGAAAGHQCNGQGRAAAAAGGHAGFGPAGRPACAQ